MKKSNVRITLIIAVLLSFISGSVGMYFFSFFFSSNGENMITKSTSLTEEDTIEKGVNNIYDAVVVVEGFTNNTLSSTGTGFIYKKANNTAYIMTNHHVISGVNTVKIILSDKTELKASVRGSEAYSDIAVLAVDASKIKSVALIGNEKNIRVGDTVFTVGSPEGVEYAGTVTKGIISGKDRMVAVALTNNTSSDYYMKVLQTDAAINPGNSGGPLCNINGEVIGITNMKLVDSTVEGIGFAIPIQDAILYAATLEKGQTISRPYLGISMLDISNNYYLWQNGIKIPDGVKEGVVIAEVSSLSPASKAGLKKGDIILSLGGEKITSVAEFRYILYKQEASEKVSIEFLRNNKIKKVEVKLGILKN